MEKIRYHHEQGNYPEAISQIPLFTALRKDCLDKILSHASILRFKPGEIFLKQGGKSPGLFILLKGAFQVSKGGREIVTLTKTGEVIGEISHILDTPHQATVASVGKAAVLQIGPEVTDTLSREDLDHFESVAYRYVAQLLAERLVKTSDRLTQKNLGDIYYL